MLLDGAKYTNKSLQCPLMQLYLTFLSLEFNTLQQLNKGKFKMTLHLWMFLNIKLGKIFCMYCAKCTCSRILGNVSLFAQNLPKLSTSSASRKKNFCKVRQRGFSLSTYKQCLHNGLKFFFNSHFYFLMSEQFYKTQNIYIMTE